MPRDDIANHDRPRSATVVVLVPRTARPPAGAPRRPETLEPRRQIARRGWALGWLMVWADRLSRRRALARAALEAPDHLLADVGLTRAEAMAAARRPFWRPGPSGTREN